LKYKGKISKKAAGMLQNFVKYCTCKKKIIEVFTAQFRVKISDHFGG
jgi:hypothetical protein